MGIRPLYDRVIIKPEETPVSSTGIIREVDITGGYTRGQVLAVGSGRLLESGEVRPLEVKVGEVVIFTQAYSGKTEQIDGKTVLIINETDILGVMTD